MSGRFLPTSANRSDWPRLVAEAVNALLRRVDLLSVTPTVISITPSTAPASPSEGDTYYDAATHKMLTWDGTQWQSHW